MVKASGIRFQGTVNDCNTVMQQLYYHGDKHGAKLTLTLNDMGSYGCYPDCEEGMTMPLYTEAMVNLMRKQPMDSFLAHSKLQHQDQLLSLNSLSFRLLDCYFYTSPANVQFFLYTKEETMRKGVQRHLLIKVPKDKIQASTYLRMLLIVLAAVGALPCSVFVRNPESFANITTLIHYTASLQFL
ncbi:hypothetical protein RYX36_002377 [Vicia faba]